MKLPYTGAVNCGHVFPPNTLILKFKNAWDSHGCSSPMDFQWRSPPKDYLFIYLFSEPHLQHMEIPSLGVKLEQQMPAYTTATALPNLSLVCILHYSSQQCWILNSLSPGMEPASSWILVIFSTAEPQQEISIYLFICLFISTQKAVNDDLTEPL